MTTGEKIGIALLVGVATLAIGCFINWAIKNPDKFNEFISAVQQKISRKKKVKSLKEMSVEELKTLLAELEVEQQYECCEEVKKILDVRVYQKETNLA